jgi:hypothetical protein
MDEDLLGDWNSNTFHVRMRNLYPSVPVIGILSVSHTAYRHQCFLPYKSARPLILYRVLNGRRYQSQAAPSSFHATDSYKWMNCPQGGASSVLRISSGLEQISARHEQILRWPCYI